MDLTWEHDEINIKIYYYDYELINMRFFHIGWGFSESVEKCFITWRNQI